MKSLDGSVRGSADLYEMAKSNDAAYRAKLADGLGLMIVKYGRVISSEDMAFINLARDALRMPTT